jgi:hypothetical protein
MSTTLLNSAAETCGVVGVVRLKLVEVTNSLEPYAMKRLGCYWLAKREINSDERSSVRE